MKFHAVTVNEQIHLHDLVMLRLLKLDNHHHKYILIQSCTCRCPHTSPQTIGAVLILREYLKGIYMYAHAMHLPVYTHTAGLARGMFAQLRWEMPRQVICIHLHHRPQCLSLTHRHIHIAIFSTAATQEMFQILHTIWIHEPRTLAWTEQVQQNATSC